MRVGALTARGRRAGSVRWETWEEAGLVSEMDRARAITDTGLRALTQAAGDKPLFLWLHYVNPHAPYTPPPPYDTAFLEPAAVSGPCLPVVDGVHGGIRREWAVRGQGRLAYYVSQYVGEIAAADAEVGRVLHALESPTAAERTVVMIASDHGESLGEYGYYFDHGEDLFDPCLRIPLIVRVPGTPAGLRVRSLATNLDIAPTILDAVKVSYPPDLSGGSLLSAALGRSTAGANRLFAQNDRGLTGAFDASFKLVATPSASGTRFAYYDRHEDPTETVQARLQSEGIRQSRRELELFMERCERESEATRRLLDGAPPREGGVTREACEKLKALGYVPGGVNCGG